MPFNASINQLAGTVSQKLTASAQEAMGSISGALSGTLSSGVSGATSMLNALSSQAGKLGLSSQSLNAAVSQVTNALDLTSMFKGLPKTPPLNVVEAKPEQTHAAQVGNSPDLKFPEDLGEHKIKLTFVSFSQNSPVDRVSKVKPLTIYLPMSPNLNETYTIGYRNASMEQLGTLADAAVQNYFKDTEKGLNGAGNSGMENVGSVIGSLSKALSTNGKDTAFAMAAKAALSLTGSVGAAVQKSLGAAINPNMATLFDSVNFREHQFTFKLYPTSQSESDKLREIIKAIRDRIIPKKLDTQFLGFPDKVNIEILPANPYVEGIKTCVVKNMSVNYAPNGVAFFKGKQGNPVAVEISLSFQETEMIFFDVSEPAKPAAPPPPPPPKAAPTNDQNRAERLAASIAVGQ